MRMIRAMYDYEHPLRTKELESIDKTIGDTRRCSV